MSEWLVYILRCADGTFYTGVTTDVTRRVREHNGELANKGARYTSARRPVDLVYSEKATNRSTAQIREFAVRSLSRSAKELLVAKSIKL